MVEEKSRIEWLDICRGIGIICIIIGHIDFGPISTWLYTFHVPLFFFLSGYVFCEGLSIRTFIKKKVKSLLVPYLGLGIPILLFNVFVRHTESLKSSAFNFFIQERWSTLWFITALFLCNCIFYLITLFVKNRLGILGIALMVSVIGYLYVSLFQEALPWNLDAAMIMSIFFCLGWEYRQYFSRIEKAISSKQILLLVGGLTNALCGGVSYIVTGSRFDLFYNKLGVAPLSAISALAGILCVILVSKKIKSKKLMYIGSNSLVYFGWHQSILLPMFWDLINKINGNEQSISLIIIVIDKVCVFISIMIVLKMVSEVINRTKLRVIIGKW